HPTIGLTLPLGNYLDVDLAADFARDNTRVLFGLNLFRFTENKSVNNNHSLNFGKAIVGEDRFEKIDNYNIHYVDTAPNANALSLPRALSRGSTLVLIGGGIHYTHHWDCYMPELAKHYRVINIDHVGAGESDKPTYFFGYTIGEQGEIINELLNRLEIKECYVLGYCYGGSIAFYLAAHYPERYKKVIAIEGFVEGINAVPISDEKSREGARSARHNIEYFGAYGLRDVIITKYRMDYPYLNWQMWYQVNRDVLYLDLRSEIKDIKAPVLYYAGGKSWANEFLGPTKDYINNNLENLSYIYIEGAGHDVDRYDQEKFMEQVIGFLGD
ncbi:MAG: alpha/beta hydrolase, partial [Candidatus Margulisbacteria bacterium]|nr:alpha/beta hydrolase [Candidatus Margulisiibacteriota bacterium]